MASPLEVWDRLNNLVQLLYSTTDVSLVVSEYKNHCWKLFVLNQQTMYCIQLNSEKELIDIMQQRQPIASSPDQFVKWFSSSMIQGHLCLIAAGTVCITLIFFNALKIGDKDEWLELRLKRVDDTNCRQEFSWQLLLKFTQHIQKEGCVIDPNHRSPSSASLINKLQEENTSLKSELKSLSMQKYADSSTSKIGSSSSSGSTATSSPSAAANHSPRITRPPPIVQTRKKGMSIINPGAKKRKHTHAEFTEPPTQVTPWNNGGSSDDG